MKNLFIVVTLLLSLASVATQAGMSCEDYFRFAYTPITSKMTREERRSAEVSNLERDLQFLNREYTINDLFRIRRAEKWLENRADYDQIQRIKAYKTAAESTVFARALEIVSQKYKIPMSKEKWDFIMDAAKYFQENGPQDIFAQLKEAFNRGQFYYIQFIDALIKKTDSKINKLEIQELFRALDAARRFQDSNLVNAIENKLIAVTSVSSRNILKFYSFNNNSMRWMKNISGTALELEIYRQFSLIEKDYINSGTIMTNASPRGSAVSGFHLLKFQFTGISYRIVYKKSPKTDIIEIEFIGTHEDYNNYNN